MTTKKCVIKIETEDPDPKIGRIISIVIMDVETQEIKIYAYENEEMMVKNSIGHFNRMKFTEIIGFDVLFDIRFIFAKCMKYRISGRRFFSSKITDLMSIVKSTKHMYNLNKAGTLDEWCNFLFKKKKRYKSEDIPFLYQGGGLDKIIEYNKNDVTLIFKLWERIDFVMRV